MSSENEQNTNEHALVRIYGPGCGNRNIPKKDLLQVVTALTRRGKLGMIGIVVSRALTLKGSRNPLLTLAFVVGPHLHERKGYSGLWGNLGSSRVSWNDDSAVH